MIARHYPPVGTSSGVQRTLKFSTYLLDHGWTPCVLTMNARAHPVVRYDQVDEIPSEVTVKYAFALDTARHLAVRGRYPRFLAYPDRWVSWWLGAVPAGLRLIRRFRPSVIWSTYPIATAHLIALTLATLTKTKWIADFRDSMTEPHYPRDPRTRAIYRWIERHTVHKAARCVFTTPGTLRMYAQRYPDIPSERWVCIPNGYDEENFEVAASTAPASEQKRRIELVHSGVLYPIERDPIPFFHAIAELKSESKIDPSDTHVMLRASGEESRYGQIISELGIGDCVSLGPSLSYSEALSEMLSASGLLLFQAANCNHQIPAKLYEYLRAKRPIFALTDSAGDSAQVLLQCGIDTIAPLDDKAAIKLALMNFLGRLRDGTAPIPDEQCIQQYSRRSGAGRLAAILEVL